MAVTDYRAAYKLEDLTDSSGNGYTLTNNNSVTFSAGLLNNAANFGASNSNKSLSVSSTLGISSGDIGISWWHKTPATLNNQLAIVQFMKNGGWSVGAWMDYANTRVLGMDHNNVFASGAFTTTTNTWYHFVVNRTSAGACELFINGTSRVTWTNGTTGDSDRLSIGENYRADWQTDGLIDMVLVYNHLLDSTDRSTLYNSGAGYDPVVAPATSTRFLQMF